MKTSTIFNAFGAWFVFCAAMSVALMAGGAWVIYKLLSHFGVI